MSRSKTLLIALILALTLTGAVWSQTDAPQFAATVNGENIPYSRLVQACLARFGAQVLQNMIAAAAIEQAAARAGVSVSKEELDARCEATQRQIELQAPFTGVNFARWLQGNQMTPEFFRHNIYLTVLLEKMVADRVNITDQMVAEDYNRNREKLRQPDKVKVAHICVSDKEKAQELRSQILAGTISFTDAAKANSIDPWTKDIGGEWGWIAKGDDPFQQAAFALTKDGEISSVVPTRMGYHIIKRLERRPEGLPPFEELQEALKLNLERERLARLAAERRLQIMQSAKIEGIVKLGPYPISDQQPPSGVATEQ